MKPKRERRSGCGMVVKKMRQSDENPNFIRSKEVCEFM